MFLSRQCKYGGHNILCIIDLMSYAFKTVTGVAIILTMIMFFLMLQTYQTVDFSSNPVGCIYQNEVNTCGFGAYCADTSTCQTYLTKIIEFFYP